MYCGSKIKVLTIAKMTAEERGVDDDEGAGDDGDDNDVSAEERGAGSVAVNERLRKEVGTSSTTGCMMTI